MRSLKGALLALLVFAGASAAVAAGSARATLPPGTLSTRPVVTRSAPSALPDTWSNLFTDDFEGAFPGPWQIVSNGTFNQASWGRWTCWSGNSPTHSVGSAAGGTAAIACDDPYPGNLNTWLVYGPFSLANGYTAAELRFQFKLSARSPGPRSTTTSTSWPPRTAPTSSAPVSRASRRRRSTSSTWRTCRPGDADQRRLGLDRVPLPHDGSVQLPTARRSTTSCCASPRPRPATTRSPWVSATEPPAPRSRSLSVDNEVAVKGLQFDLVYDEAVANFTGVNVTGPGPRHGGLLARGERRPDPRRDVP